MIECVARCATEHSKGFHALRQSQADIAVERGVIVEQLRRRPAMHDAAALEHERDLRQRERDLGVLLDQDEGVVPSLRSCGGSRRRVPRRRWAPGLRAARRAAAAPDWSSARARSPASAARRPRADCRNCGGARRCAGRDRTPRGRSQRPARAATVRFSSTRQRRKNLALLRHPADAGSARGDAAARAVMSSPRHNMRPRPTWV